jgi:hypothetical protein
VRLPVEGMSARRAAWILLATTAALLAKETAIVAPGVVLLLGLLAWSAHPEQFSWRPFGMAFAIVLLPVIAYLGFRAPAITASISGHADPAYTPDLSNVPANVWRFFAFPFRLKLVEMSAAVFRSPWQPLLAGTAHLALVGTVYRLFGVRYVLAYVAGYFLFLLPVMALPSPGVQCLYGAALAMSLAIAAVWERLLVNRHRGAVLLIAAAAVSLFAHGLVMQWHFYDVGLCQTRLLASVDSLLAQQPAAATARIVVVPEPGAPLRVGIRAVSAREAYTANGRPIVTFESPEQREAALSDDRAMRVRMTAACTLAPK